MSKLYFRYAAMNAGKSTNLLQVAHNYEERGRDVVIFTVALADTLEEMKTVCRCGRKASMVIRHNAQGERVWEGEQVQVGGNETYESVCPPRFYGGKC